MADPKTSGFVPSSLQRAANDDWKSRSGSYNVEEQARWGQYVSARAADGGIVTGLSQPAGGRGGSYAECGECRLSDRSDSYYSAVDAELQNAER